MSAAEDSTSPPVGLSLDRVTTAERIADGICDLILRGEVEPGTPLKESQLQETIGVSRNTIREALRLLARDRLVTYHAYRGVSVAELTGEDVIDLFKARTLLEMRAVESIASMTDEQFEGLNAARVNREREVEAGDWHAAFESDMEFHAAIVDLLGSEALNEFFVGLLRRLRLGFYLKGGLSTEGRERDTKQHRKIEELVKEGDVDGCRDAVAAHLSDSQDLLLELLAQSATTGTPS